MHIRRQVIGRGRQWVLGLFAVAWVFGSLDAVAESYTYDAQGRLTSVTSDSGVVTYYCYDTAGNRTYVGPTPCP